MRHGVLEGVKVADFSWIVVGGLITKVLGQHGATVVRVESATRPDITRITPPYKDSKPGLERSGYFALYNDSKYGITLNLNHPRGVEVARRLIAWADVLVESFTPGTMEGWGLGYEEVRKVKPEIIMLSTTNQGQTGPHSRHPGFGNQLVSLSGFTQVTGWPDRGPVQPYGAYTDIIAPRFAVAALIAALDYRRRTGRGQYLDLSQYETAVHFLSPLILDYTANGREATRAGNRCPRAAPHGAYRCRGDDRWCALSVFTEEEWQAFCHVLGDPPWTKESGFATLSARLENVEELDRLVEEWTAQHSAEEVMTLMQRVGVAAGVVKSPKDISEDPQLRERHHFRVLRHPEMGEFSYNGPSFQLSRTPGEVRRPNPLLGEHNEYVYKQLLGMSEEEYVELLLGGVFE